MHRALLAAAVADLGFVDLLLLYLGRDLESSRKERQWILVSAL